MTHDAGITSLLRYALVATGSCCSPDLIRSASTQIVNIAARKARSESLHFIVGTDAIYNLYVRHCADFLDACLRVSNRTINARLRKEPIAYYVAGSFEATDIQMLPPFDDVKRILELTELPEAWQHSYWFRRVMGRLPKLQNCAAVEGTYVANADGIGDFLLFRQMAYHFREVYFWLDVALQVLTRAGWPPECSNPGRGLPPEDHAAQFHRESLLPYRLQNRGSDTRKTRQR